MTLQLCSICVTSAVLLGISGFLNKFEKDLEQNKLIDNMMISSNK